MRSGPYGTVESSFNAMIAAIQAKELVPTKDMWEVYFSPPETPPAEIRTDVIWPIAA